MPHTFDLDKHYAGPDGLVSQSPFWFVGIVRFKEAVTYDRKKRKSKESIVAFDEVPPLIISGQCNQLTVMTSKNSYVSNLQALFEPGAYNILSQAKPGDWVFAWMLADEYKGRQVLKAVRENKAANGFWDGIKFMGRVQGVRKRKVVDHERGTARLNYLLTASGFSEFGYSVFYEPHLLKDNIAGGHLDAFGLAVTDIVAEKDTSVQDGGLIDINKMMPALTKLLFGETGAYAKSGAIQDPAGGSIPAAPQGALHIPKTAAKWLGMPNATVYDHILTRAFGVQQYSPHGGAMLEGSKSPWTGFLPESTLPLRGQFSLVMPPIMNQPFWTVLNQFLNAPVNEMYTALRANKEGRVLPTLVIRQIPFSRTEPQGADDDTTAKYMDDKMGSDPDWMTGKAHTKFLSLPRWKLTDAMVQTADLGRSDALRVNYVHIGGVPAAGTAVDEVGMFVRCPPLRDDSDISRAGMRPYQATVNCTFKDVVIGPALWRDIIADVMMTQHLTLTGSIQTYGIDLPISPGDNLEYEGGVFHIESATHSCFLDMEGRRQFISQFQVSNGVLANPEDESEPFANIMFADGAVDDVGGEVAHTED